MKKANIHSYSLDINYRCPYCRMFFRLVNGGIPTAGQKEIECDGCGQSVLIDPVNVDIYIDEEPEHTSYANFDKAIKIMSSLGFTAAEANIALSKVCEKLEPTASAADLSKLALATMKEE